MGTLDSLHRAYFSLRRDEGLFGRVSRPSQENPGKSQSVEPPESDKFDRFIKWQEVGSYNYAAKVPFFASCWVLAAFQHGVRKHGAGSWAGAYRDDFFEPYFKCMRHLAACIEAKSFAAIDEESGVPHLAKAAANLTILLALAIGDDEYV